MGSCIFLLFIAQLAGVSQSGWNSKLGQDINLQDKPADNDQYKNPDTHLALLLFPFYKKVSQ
jgi:hypothetical protein